MAVSTVIICIVLALIIIFAVVNSAKHFRGEGGCCGGGSDIKVKKKKLANVKETLVISIDGMTCKYRTNLMKWIMFLPM